MTNYRMALRMVMAGLLAMTVLATQAQTRVAHNPASTSESTTQGQPLRDPTMAPAEAQTSEATAPASPLGVDGMSVIVRDGKSWLVVGTRLIAPGQKTGPWVLERITETEVWLRDGKQVRKVPRFAGIQRTDVATAAAERCAKAKVTPEKPQHRVKAAKAAPAPAMADTPCDATPL